MLMLCEPIKLTGDTVVEKRRGLRIQQSRPIKVFEGLSGRFYGGQTSDVSATGLRIELPVGTPVRSGSILNIHVGLSTGGQPLANRREMMPARVVWVDRRSAFSRGRLQAGVELLANISAHADAA